MRASINVKQTQLTLVRNEWTKEWDAMAVKMADSNKPEEIKFGLRMESLEFDNHFIFLRQELIHLYLEKVRYIFALAFFQWRKTRAETEAAAEVIKVIFDERRDSMIKQS